MSQGSHSPLRVTQGCGKQLGANPSSEHSCAWGARPQTPTTVQPELLSALQCLPHSSPALLPMLVFWQVFLIFPIQPLQMSLPQPLRRCKKVSLPRHGDASSSSCPPCRSLTGIPTPTPSISLCCQPTSPSGTACSRSTIPGLVKTHRGCWTEGSCPDSSGALCLHSGNVLRQFQHCGG